MALEVRIVLVGEASEVVALSRAKRQQDTHLTFLWPAWCSYQASLSPLCSGALLSLHLCVKRSQETSPVHIDIGHFEGKDSNKGSEPFQERNSQVRLT